MEPSVRREAVLLLSARGHLEAELDVMSTESIWDWTAASARAEEETVRSMYCEYLSCLRMAVHNHLACVYFKTDAKLTQLLGTHCRSCSCACNGHKKPIQGRPVLFKNHTCFTCSRPACVHLQGTLRLGFLCFARDTPFSIDFASGAERQRLLPVASITL
mmetsp:Transcript_442/g.1517  ORF Transcript_442/g.1517 Transcript_442/m.1517 type:complete len:160 (-) Transcript_442:264-743(-)